ncbi:hypothetical protein AN2336V5_0999 [Klebsiella oxytoca]|jgi:Ner family transcriptional regulator|nr:Ner-like regulatory protein [Klebsiella michiganensis E718]CAH6087156.1 hypothetical protein AN2336V5_0999 [Klebsiella oxytoca]
MSMMQPEWHSADIIAAPKKRGTSLSAVSHKSGLASSTMANALNRHWPKGERLIAEALALRQRKSGLPAITSQARDGASDFHFQKSKNPAIGWVL